VPAPAPATAAPAARSSIRGDSAGSEEARPPAASSASPAMASHETSIVYPLWYATNRTQTQDAAQKVAYSDEYSTEMNYGKVLVDIPEDFLKAPGWLALFRSAERLIRVREPTPLAPDALFDDMRQQLNQYEGREALIYLHGF